MSSVEPPAIRFHPDFVLNKYSIGHEQSPLLVIDNFVAEPQVLIDQALALNFAPVGKSFPGIRAIAPQFYQQFLLTQLRPYLEEHFEIGKRPLGFSMCHYSLVTTPASQLAMLQRIPHFDSLDGTGLATVHYLFRGNLGGTAFYRHRKTGYETIDESRRLGYFRSLESENDGPNIPAQEYINGGTALFEQIDKQDGIFNRILIYRRNILHSGCIDKDFIPDPNPLTGRLSINSFINVLQ